MEENRNSDGCINSAGKDSLVKDTEPNVREKMDTSKRETMSYMQDDARPYTENEKKFLKILANTGKVYDYALSDEYCLSLLKHNGMQEYIDEYITIIDENNLNSSSCIIELGESSIQRFLVNKEKQVLEFPPQEHDNLIIVRDGE
jgi:hypothetical protein